MHKKYIPALYCQKNLRVGILGGSFDPLHKGHLYIAENARKYYKLDYVIFLLSKQNPLKKQSTKFDIRFDNLSNKLKYYPYFIPSNFENTLKNSFSYNVLNQLKKVLGRHQYYWIMGEDNLYNFHMFKNFNTIVKSINIIVASRAQPSYKALCSKTALIYKNCINISHFYDSIKNSDINGYNIAFMLQKRENISSSEYRKKYAKQ